MSHCSVSHFTVLGDDSIGGAYVLRITVQESLVVSFGRFKRGLPIKVPPGEYLYLGSAMNGLARRLVRHATRSEAKAPHPIREDMLDLFPTLFAAGDSLLPNQGKKLHWNVDHLLECDEVVLSHVFIIRSDRRLEAALGVLLEQDPGTFVLEKGLGANDFARSTHLLGVASGESWWESLPDKLATLFQVTPQDETLAWRPQMQIQ